MFSAYKGKIIKILAIMALFIPATGFAEDDLWIGKVFNSNSIIPFALYQDDQWHEVWKEPVVLTEDYKQYLLNSKQPLPKQPVSYEIWEQGKVSIDQISPEWLNGDKVPKTWYDINTRQGFSADILTQLEEGCSAVWGLLAGNSVQIKSEFVVSPSIPFTNFETVEDNKVRQKLLIAAWQSSLDLEKKDLSYYKSVEHCKKTNRGDPSYPISWYQKGRMKACEHLSPKTKDNRSEKSLINVDISSSVLSNGSVLYHIGSDLRFPEPTEEDLRNKNYAFLNVTHFDAWFLSDGLQLTHLDGCGVTLNCGCEKGFYNVKPYATLEYNGRVFIVASQGCYFGGTVIYELMNKGIEAVLGRGWGGC